MLAFGNTVSIWFPLTSVTRSDVKLMNVVLVSIAISGACLMWFKSDWTSSNSTFSEASLVVRIEVAWDRVSEEPMPELWPCSVSWEEFRDDFNTGSKKFSCRVPASISIEKTSSEGDVVSGTSDERRIGRAREGKTEGTARPSISLAKSASMLTNVLVTDVARSRFSFNLRRSSSDNETYSLSLFPFRGRLVVLNVTDEVGLEALFWRVSNVGSTELESMTSSNVRERREESRSSPNPTRLAGLISAP
jgi:hypothetical protein